LLNSPDFGEVCNGVVMNELVLASLNSAEI